jgi:hypothetical protein
VLWKGGLPARDTSKQKPSIAFGDFNDVTLGSSAILEDQISIELEKNREAGSNEIVETRSFPSPLFNGFGFITNCK